MTRSETAKPFGFLFAIPRVGFDLRVPFDVKDYMHGIMRDYAKNMVVQPMVDIGKTVVEVTEDAVNGCTHTVRLLATATFASKDQMMQALMTGSDDKPYYESWMVTLIGANTGDGFAVKSAEFYVRREGGWETVVSRVEQGMAPNTDKGEGWPEPAKEPIEAPREELRPC